MKPKLIVVLGPTAVGKSATALDLATRFNAEIISADSQQVYRQMDIGTAKPTKAHREKVAHHLIDIVDPDEEFNAAMFRRLAAESAGQISARKKNVIICGGTGLYLKALTRGLFVGPGRDTRIRQALESEMREQGIGALHRRLGKLDPGSLARIHANDRQRIIRALEVYQLSGRTISEWQKEHAFGEAAFELLKIGINRPRPGLYDLIDHRCDRMIQAGLVDEVRELLAKGYAPELKSMQSVGYRHAGLIIRGEMALDDAVALMKRDTRHLAKRQLTWFRGDQEIRWFHPEADRQKIEAIVGDFLGGRADLTQAVP